MNDLLQLAVSAIAVLLTLLYASWQDIKTRTVATATWYPAAVVGGVVVLYFWHLQFQHPTNTAISVLAVSSTHLRAHETLRYLVIRLLPANKNT